MDDLKQINNDDVIDLKRLYLIAKRNIRVILMSTGALFIPALLFILLATPEYTSKTDLLLDKRTTEIVSDISSLGEMGFDTASIVSEVEVLKSRRVATEALKNLTNKGYFKDEASNDSDRAGLLSNLLRKLKVSRVGETYILSISYTDKDPQFAADAANAFAEAYIEEQLKSLSETSIQGSLWITKKIEELKQESLKAEEEIKSYRSKYNLSSQKNLSEEQDSSISEETDTKKFTLSELKSLEKKAETYNELYNTYLEKLGTSNIQQSIPITETRVISAAFPSKDKSHPKTTIILGLSLIMGCGLGLIVALIRDNFDKTLKRAGQVLNELKIPFLGFLPKIDFESLRELEFISNKNIRNKLLLNISSIEDPHSSYSILIRSIINKIDNILNNQAKIIAIVEDDRHKLRSNLAANIAVYSSQHSRCLLIQGNIGSQGRQINSISKSETLGLEDVLINNLGLEDCILTHNELGLSIVNLSGKNSDKALLNLSPRKMKTLIDRIKNQYDIIFIDCPPLTKNADLYSFASIADHIIIVAQWGTTLSNSLKFYLKQNSLPEDKILGLILENTDADKMVKDYGYKVSN